MSVLERLRDGLVVSCQPVPGGPMDTTEIVVAYARAAADGGARGLRVAGPDRVAAVRAATKLPLVGLVKRPIDGRERITPLIEDVRGLIDAGADIVAFDATRRARPVAVAELLTAIRAGGRLAMADCSDAEDGRAALAAGADIVGSSVTKGNQRQELMNTSVANALAGVAKKPIGRSTSPRARREGFTAPPALENSQRQMITVTTVGTIQARITQVRARRRPGKRWFSASAAASASAVCRSAFASTQTRLLAPAAQVSARVSTRA